MSKILKVLVVPVDGVGHVNACIGVAQALKERGHKIIFVVAKNFKGKLIPYGFEEEILETVNSHEHHNEHKHTSAHEHPSAHEQPSAHEHQCAHKAAGSKPESLFTNKSPLEKLRMMSKMGCWKNPMLEVIKNEPLMKSIIDKNKPDVLLIDHIFGSPSIIYSDKPWVRINSHGPLSVFKNDKLPPSGLGLSVNSDKNEWTEGRELVDNMSAKASVEYNEWLTKQGFPAIPNKECIPESPYLNLYLYPEELDYTDVRPIPDKYFRIDAAVRKVEEKFKLPEELRKSMKSSNKLIYLSMGSGASRDVELMKRLVQILSKSEHKFIVSKGLNADKYELAANMWGEKSVPQTRVISLVDLVITHGGNNSMTETFCLGKPMIVMPIAGDQIDNAQKVDEKGFGVWLDPYKCTEEELLKSIDRLLNDRELKERLSVASHKIQNSNTLKKASELIESLVK